MKNSNVVVTQMFTGATAFLATFTNCGHSASAASANAGICMSGPYAPSSDALHGPPTAWQINVVP
jgi:hypothetical protein